MVFQYEFNNGTTVLFQAVLEAQDAANAVSYIRQRTQTETGLRWIVVAGIDINDLKEVFQVLPSDGTVCLAWEQGVAYWNETWQDERKHTCEEAIAEAILRVAGAWDREAGKAIYQLKRSQTFMGLF